MTNPIIQDWDRGMARDMLALKLKGRKIEKAAKQARHLATWFSTAVISWELIQPKKIDMLMFQLRANRFATLLDLRLSDNPSSIEDFSRILGRMRPTYVTYDINCTEEMFRAGIHGLASGALEVGADMLPLPLAIGTVEPKNEDDEYGEIALGEAVMQARSSGCVGVKANCQTEVLIGGIWPVQIFSQVSEDEPKTLDPDHLLMKPMPLALAMKTTANLLVVEDLPDEEDFAQIRAFGLSLRVAAELAKKDSIYPRRPPPPLKPS